MLCLQEEFSFLRFIFESKRSSDDDTNKTTFYTEMIWRSKAGFEPQYFFSSDPNVSHTVAGLQIFPSVSPNFASLILLK